MPHDLTRFEAPRLASPRLGVAFIIAFLLRINFACLICQLSLARAANGQCVMGVATPHLPPLHRVFACN